MPDSMAPHTGGGVGVFKLVAGILIPTSTDTGQAQVSHPGNTLNGEKTYLTMGREDGYFYF